MKSFHHSYYSFLYFEHIFPCHSYPAIFTHLSLSSVECKLLEDSGQSYSSYIPSTQQSDSSQVGIRKYLVVLFSYSHPVTLCLDNSEASWALFSTGSIITLILFLKVFHVISLLKPHDNFLSTMTLLTFICLVFKAPINLAPSQIYTLDFPMTPHSLHPKKKITVLQMHPSVLALASYQDGMEYSPSSFHHWNPTYLIQEAFSHTQRLNPSAFRVTVVLLAAKLSSVRVDIS